MRIELACLCGASAVFDDPRGSYAFGEWAKARVSAAAGGPLYEIQREAALWQDRHKVCLGNRPRNEVQAIDVQATEETATVALLSERLATVTMERDALIGTVRRLLPECVGLPDYDVARELLESLTS